MMPLVLILFLEYTDTDETFHGTFQTLIKGRYRYEISYNDGGIQLKNSGGSCPTFS